MNTYSPALMIVIGLVLRLVVPMAVTALIAYAFHKLDARWQEEARKELKTQAVDEIARLEEQEAY